MKKIILTLLFLFFSYSASAQSVEEQNSITNQQNSAIQSQKQIDIARDLQKELRQINEDHVKQIDEENDEDDLDENDGKIVQNYRAIQCFRINKITFSKNSLLSLSQENMLTKNYIGQCLTLHRAVKLGKEVTEFLFGLGFVTSSAKVSANDIINGLITVNITESYLENIIINKNKFSDKTQKFMIFGANNEAENSKKPLHIQEINSGITQMNHLRSNNAAVKFLPGSANNKAIALIETNPKNTTRINLSYNNIGSRTTGEKLDTISLTKDNLLHLNDIFSISRTANDTDSNYNNRQNNALSGSYSFPIGRFHSLSFNASKSSYLFMSGSSGDDAIHGKTISKSISLDSNLIRDKKFKLNSNFNLNNRYNQSFTNDVRNELQSRRATIASVSLSNAFFFKDSALILKPTYSKSLHILNAKQDSGELAKESPHADFNIFKFYTNYSRKLELPYLKTPALYNITLDSQYSENRLYSIDQISSGGFYSVRGFKGNSINGDSGYNIRNEISSNLGKLFLTESSSEKLAFLNYFSVAPFFDYGYVRGTSNAASGRLSGTGLRLGFTKENINASLNFSHATSKSQLLSKNHQESNLIYFIIGTELDFF